MASSSVKAEPGVYAIVAPFAGRDTENGSERTYIVDCECCDGAGPNCCIERAGDPFFYAVENITINGVGYPDDCLDDQWPGGCLPTANLASTQGGNLATFGMTWSPGGAVGAIFASITLNGDLIANLQHDGHFTTCANLFATHTFSGTGNFGVTYTFTVVFSEGTC